MAAARPRVRARARSARRGARDAPDLIPPDGLGVGRLAVGDDEWAVFDWPAPAPAFPELSTAEREVAALALAGLSNAEIAVARGAAERTIANQLAAAYRKLGIGSRLELFARAARRAGR